MGRKFKNQRKKKQNQASEIIEKKVKKDNDDGYNKSYSLVKRNVFFEEFYKVIK